MERGGGVEQATGGLFALVLATCFFGSLVFLVGEECFWPLGLEEF